MERSGLKGRVLLGLVIIAVGIIAMLDAFEIVYAWEVFYTYWPVLLILLGVGNLLDRRSSNMSGLILIVIGGFFLADKLDLVILENIRLSHIIIPTIIILVGVNLVLPDRRKNQDIIVEKVERPDDSVDN